MEFLDKKRSNLRRKYLKWILGSAAGIAIAWIFSIRRKPEVVKMLTKDGKLVEVPLDRLPKKTRKVNLKEMQTWIWKHNT
jgi:hypothetical protein